MPSRIIACLFCFLIFGVGSFKALGQDPEAQPTATPDRRAAELRTELELEKLRTDLAEQKQKTLAFRLPGMADENKPLAGSITLKDEDNRFEIESVALSYEALSNIAKQIGISLQAGTGDFNQLVIYSEGDFRTLVQYRIFESQAAPELKAYDTLLQPPSGEKSFGIEALGPLTTSTALVRSAIDLISLFRTDTVIANKEVTIDPTALGALVANEMKLTRPGFKVYFPMAYVPEHDWNPDDQSSVLTQLTKLYTYHAVVKEVLADYDQTAAVDKPRHLYYRKIPALKALNEQVGKFLANYENKEGEAAANRLRDLVRAEQLNRMLESDPRTGILQLTVLKAGGSRRITRNLILASKIRHSGSAIVEYLLFDKTGLLRSSEMFYYHTGFQKMDNTRSVKN